MDFSQVFACQISSVILRHYFNSFGHFSVVYPNLPYHIFWARVAGCLIWACSSSKIPNAATYPREVKRVRQFQGDTSKGEIHLRQDNGIQCPWQSTVLCCWWCWLSRLVEQWYALPSALFFRCWPTGVTQLHDMHTTERVKKDIVALSKLNKKVSKQAKTGHEWCDYNTALVIKHHFFDLQLLG